MVMFFLLFGLRSFLRKEWLAIIAAAILLTVLRGSALTALHPALDLGIHFGIYVTILLVIVRFGLLTTVFGVFFINCLGRCAYSTDFNSWVNGYSTMTTLLLAGLVLWAFRRSLENHEILEANA
jgi:nicotinamide riboside transporter PnuC